MSISVCTTEVRFGGLEPVANSLKRQTFTDFEWIVCDELCERRRDLFYEKTEGLNARIIQPYRKYDVYDDSNGWNSCLREASGELVVFVIDFMWLPPDFLQRHWDFYREHSGYSGAVFLDRYDFPPLRKDIENGLWWIFNRPFDHEFAERWFKENEPVYRERRGGVGIQRENGLIEIPGEKGYMVPDAIPLEVLKALQGWDELYCGGYG